MSAPKSARPTDLLFNILVTFLCPLFLGGPTGNTDIAVARAAAIEMLSSFRIRNAWDLLGAVQVVGFAIAGLGSLGLSIDDELPVNTVLRCRSNANALQRSSDRAQARMDKRQAQEGEQAAIEPPDPDAVLEARRQAAEAQRMVAAAQARIEGAEPDTEAEDSRGMIALREVLECDAVRRGLLPASILDTHTQPPEAPAAPDQLEPARVESARVERDWAEGVVHAEEPIQAAAREPAPLAASRHVPCSRREREGQMIWAGAMATVATEFAQELADLPPSEQRLHKIRVKALHDACGRLTGGVPTDPRAMPGIDTQMAAAAG